MIVSFTPGRVRVRDNAFKDVAALVKIIKYFKELGGVSSVESNPVSGSILVKYDAGKIPSHSVSAFASYVKKAEPSLARYMKQEKKEGKAFNRAMAASLAVCLLSPAAGMMRLHVYSALFFTGLSLKHMYDYRKQII